jgi:hypothetical protein
LCNQFHQADLQIESCIVSIRWNYFYSLFLQSITVYFTWLKYSFDNYYWQPNEAIFYSQFTWLIYKLNLASCQQGEIILYFMFHQAQIQFYYFVQSVSLGCYNNWIMQRNSLAKLFCTVCFTWLIYKLNHASCQQGETIFYSLFHLTEIQFDNYY